MFRSSAIKPELPAPSGLVVPGNRPAEVVAFEVAMVDFSVEAAEILGVPKSVAAIYGIVFASAKPLSFADIATRLDLSNGSISQGLRVLREMGALREVSTDADRTELFAPDVELRKLVRRFLDLRLQRQLDTGRSRLKRLQQSLARQKGPDAAVLEKRLNYLLAWHDKARALLPMAKTFLKLTRL